MKSFSKKSVSLVLIFTIFMAIFMPTIVRADTPLFQHRITVSPDIMTVYVGNVSVDGTSEIKYLYIENAVNSATVNSGLNQILTSDYSDMLARGTISSDGTIKVSNSHESDMSASWKNATNVANTYYGTTGTISDTSTTQINYNSTKYNEAVSNASALASAEINAISNYQTAYNERKNTWEASNSDSEFVYDRDIESYELPVVTDYDLSSLTGEYIILDNITNGGEENFKYAMLNGHLTMVRLVDIDRTIVRVVNTSANVVQPTKINTLNISIASPKVGDTATTTTKPNVTIDNNAGYKLDFTQYLTKPETEGGIQFTGTFEKDKDYYVEVSLEANENYNFASSDNMTLKVNGKTTDYTINNSPDGSRYFLFYAKVQPTAEEESAPTTETTYEYIDNTANQTYTINEDDALTFRINADFSLFENGGKVYVDGTETKDFTASSGSTIITFAKDYVSSLSEGEHTLKVAFNNGGEATTKFTVAKANATADTTTEETTPTTTTETETTTSNNPKTGDNIITIFSIFAIATLGTFTTLKLNRNRKARKH